MSRFRLEIIVFIAGAVIMIFELVGSRVMAPYLGSSLYVWTSLIGVILGSLSFGYWYGGRLADRRPEHAVLSKILFAAAILVAAVSYFDYLTLKFVRGLLPDLRAASFAGAVILFAPASVLLGMVAPFAVRLRLSDIEETGKVVGRLYAISTVGSISGTFLAGFFLIAFFGTTQILLVLSVLLLATSFLGFRIKRVEPRVVAGLLLLVAVSFRAYLHHSSDTGRIDIDTDYNRVWIDDAVLGESKRPARLLRIDGLFAQAAVYLDNVNELYPNYTRFYRLAEHFRPDARAALAIGGGGYTFPRDYLRRNADVAIDAVEIDPELTELSRQFFALRDHPRMKIYHEDGRMFVARTKKEYDVVFLDAFNSAATIPFHLTTVEFTRELAGLLGPGGVLITNVVSAVEGDHGRMLRALYAVYQKVFPQVHLFPVDNPSQGTTPQSVIVVAIKSPDSVELSSENEEYQGYLANRWTSAVTDDVAAFTDNHAPVEQYSKGVLQYYYKMWF